MYGVKYDQLYGAELDPLSGSLAPPLDLHRWLSRAAKRFVLHCCAVQREGGATSIMKISIDLEIDASELPLATELLNTLRSGNTHTHMIAITALSRP